MARIVGHDGVSRYAKGNGGSDEVFVNRLGSLPKDFEMLDGPEIFFKSLGAIALEERLVKVTFEIIGDEDRHKTPVIRISC